MQSLGFKFRTHFGMFESIIASLPTLMMVRWLLKKMLEGV